MSDPIQEQTDDYMALLRAARKRNGISIHEVAERMGISVEDVQDLERPGSDPALSTIRRYCLASEVVPKHTVTPAPTEET